MQERLAMRPTERRREVLNDIANEIVDKSVELQSRINAILRNPDLPPARRSQLHRNVLGNAIQSLFPTKESRDAAIRRRMA